MPPRRRPAAEPEARAARLAPPPDPLALRLAFEAAFDAGKLDEARKQAVASAAAHRAVGQFHAAVDACYQALAIAPADPGVHFALAQLYLDRGWRSLAADKLVLIGRLAELTGDTASQARLCDLVARRFPDDARLAAMCARLTHTERPRVRPGEGPMYTRATMPELLGSILDQVRLTRSSTSGSPRSSSTGCSA